MHLLLDYNTVFELLQNLTVLLGEIDLSVLIIISCGFSLQEILSKERPIVCLATSFLCFQYWSSFLAGIAFELA